MITQEQIKIFQDRYNIIHHERVIDGNPLTSENGPLFTGELLTLDPALLSIKTIIKILNLLKIDNEGHYKPTPVSAPGDHFSLDNVLGILAMEKALGHKLTRKEYPKQTGWLMHPRDVMFRELYLRPGSSRWLFRLYGRFSVTGPRSETSGKILWWLRFKILGLDTKELEDVMIKEHGPNPMKDVFSIYFRNNNHPINLIMSK